MAIAARRVPAVLCVLAGSLLLVAPLSFLSVTGGVVVIDRVTGAGVVGDPTSGPVGLVAAVVSLLGASVAADARFRGVDALRLGGPGTWLRLAAVWCVVGGGALVVIDFAVRSLLFAFESPNGAVAAPLAVVVLASSGAVAVRALTAFRRGWQGADG